MKIDRYPPIVILICIGFALATAYAQGNFAQEVSTIFEQSCLICHGPHGSFTEQLIIQSSQELIDAGKVIPGNPDSSIFYQRLIETAVEKRMPLGQPPLPPAAIQTIRQWIQAGAPDWNTAARTDINFITTEEMLQTIENHIQSLDTFDRAFARYFTSTHLYNAGETTETLRAYQRALSKLVNSLSWGREVTKPQPIDSQATIFYIDLRDYEWEIGTNRWTLIETEYPYNIVFDAPTQTALREKLTNLRAEMNCETPFVHVDWFLATASLPPLYHDILDLPLTDSELEARLEVNVIENLRNAAGKRVWRAGFSDSGVSNHNRVVERHISRYGAYWKSYDFAGSADSQNILTHPLNFTHDGGEIIFNLPNGLQAYYLADAGGNRLNAAPIEIVRNPATSDPTVRNGLSCIGCHTEGMKTFEDEVRSVVEQNENPPFDKDQVLRLYVETSEMDAFVEKDTERYRQALEATGDIFGGIEPVQRFHEAFQGPLGAAYAAAAVGLETEIFLGKIREDVRLQNLGLQVLENGTMKRDAWTSNFDDVISALNTPDSTLPPVVQRPELIPGASVNIPDANLRAAIAEALGKSDTTVVSITIDEMTSLTWIDANNRGIQDLTGLEYAINLEDLYAPDNQITDLSPLSELINLRVLNVWHNPIESLSPIAGLSNLEHITLVGDGGISDLSPLAGLVKLRHFLSWGNPISDLSPLAGLTQLETLDICGSEASDISPLAKLTGLKELYLVQNRISDVSPLSGLTSLTRLSLSRNNISDVSPLAGLTHLKWLGLHRNSISDFSPLAELPETTTISRAFNPGVPTGGPKIEGPWSWVTVPGERLDSNTDLLAEASAGTITERQVATDGVIQGTSVGNNRWTQGKIALSRSDKNIADMLDEIGSKANTDNTNRIIYGSVILDSPREQDTNLFFGCGGRIKIWHNGALIYQSLAWRSRGQVSDYLDFLPVTLTQGANVLLVAIDDGVGWWSAFFGFEEGTEYAVSTVSTKARAGYALSKSAIHVDDTFTLDLNAEEVTDLAGWQFDIVFDPAVLEAVEVKEGDFLKTDGGATFFQGGTIDNTTGKVTGLRTARISERGVSGEGTLLSVTFMAKVDGETQITLENFEFGAISGDVIPSAPPEIIITVGGLPPWDVNQDGRVSVLDLILVAKDLGADTPANPRTDVNRDGIINIQDLILVAQHLGESTAAAAPSVTAAINNGELTPAMVQAWITQAQIEDDGSIAFQQGIANLERLLTLFIPEETALLHNYPNPFNPETWIPYQLAEPAEVTLTIYSVNGTLVRTLKLGHQPAGIYQTRTRAAYWNGKNQVGEPVASGVYFYTLSTESTRDSVTAGNFNATRKMLIRK